MGNSAHVIPLQFIDYTNEFFCVPNSADLFPSLLIAIQCSHFFTGRGGGPIVPSTGVVGCETGDCSIGPMETLVGS